jgi:hypothetical protein
MRSATITPIVSSGPPVCAATVAFDPVIVRFLRLGLYAKKATLVHDLRR